jgi:hypothetical protein
MRARSYHASPGVCQASVLWIVLWMLWINMLVSRCEVVDERGCGKVDNDEDANLTRVGEASVVHKRQEVSTVQLVNSVIPATGMPADLPFFRCSGCPAHARSVVDLLECWPLVGIKRRP